MTTLYTIDSMTPPMPTQRHQSSTQLSLNEARAQIVAALVGFAPSVERVALEEAHGRRLAVGMRLSAASTRVDCPSRLAAGSLLGARQLGWLAAINQRELRVTARPRVEVITAGTSLCPLGELCRPGQRYDHERYLLAGLLRQAGAQILATPTLPARPAALARTLQHGAAVAPLILLCVPDPAEFEDAVAVLATMGVVYFDSISATPISRCAMAHIDDALVVVISEVLISFLRLVLPAVQLLSGAEPFEPRPMRARCGNTLSCHSAYPEHRIVQIMIDAQGESLLLPLADDEARAVGARQALLTLLAASQVGAGATVMVQPIEWFFSTN